MLGHWIVYIAGSPNVSRFGVVGTSQRVTLSTPESAAAGMGGRRRVTVFDISVTRGRRRDTLRRPGARRAVRSGSPERRIVGVCL